MRCELMLFRGRRDQAGAMRMLRELCRAPENETEDLMAATKVLSDAGWLPGVDSTLADGLLDPGANPETGALWIRTRVRAGLEPRMARLDRPTVSEGVRRRAWHAYVNWLVEKSLRLKLTWALWRRGNWLRADDQTWGSVGYALIRQQRSRKLVRWMRDWRDRHKVEPWMLYNLGHALIEIRRDTDLSAVVAATLKLPADHTRPMFVAWAAWQSALAGDAAAAREMLAVFDDHTKLEFAKVTAGHARALVGVLSQPQAERRQAFRKAQSELRALEQKHPSVLAKSYMRRAQARTLYTAACAAQLPLWRGWYSIPRISHAWQTAALVVAGAAIFVGILAGIASQAGNSGTTPLPLVIPLIWAFTYGVKKFRKR